MRFIFAPILFRTWLAYLVGFVVPWRIAKLEQMLYKTTALRLDQYRRRGNSSRHPSLILCVIGWPDSRIGVFVNVVLLVVMRVGRRSDAFLCMLGRR